MAGSSLFRPRENERPINASTFTPRPDSYFGRGKIAAVPSDPADVKRPRILVASDNAIEAPSGAERTPVPKQGPKPFMSASSGPHRAHAGVALEIFCGSAGLSHACHCVGFRIIPIDWSGNKHASKVPVTKKICQHTRGTGANMANDGRLAREVRASRPTLWNVQSSS